MKPLLYIVGSLSLLFAGHEVGQQTEQEAHLRSLKTSREVIDMMKSRHENELFIARENAREEARKEAEGPSVKLHLGDIEIGCREAHAIFLRAAFEAGRRAAKREQLLEHKQTLEKAVAHD